jgi:hypothetical protein
MSLFNKAEQTIRDNYSVAGIRTILALYGNDYVVNTVSLGTKEITQITCTADDDSSLSGKYFLINAPGGWSYYVWFNIDYLSSDPLLDNKVAIEINISANDTASTIAQAISDALPPEFVASVNAGVIVITCVDAGSVTNASAGTSGFSVSISQQGISPNTNNEYLEVYGSKGSVVEEYDSNINICGVVVGDDWIPVDNRDAGTFNRGYLYSGDTRIKPGYVLNIDRGYDIKRRYLIGLDQSIGTHVAIKLRWRLESLND